MDKYTLFLMVFSVFVLPANWTHAQNEAEAGIRKKPNVPKIVVTSLEIDDKALNMVYEIKNESEDDTWVLVGIQHLNSEDYVMNADVFMTENDRTLIVGRRFDLPIVVTDPPFFGRYVRLPPGESQTEWIFIELPVHPISKHQSVMFQEKDFKYATSLAIELGYYPGNMPEIIFSMFGETPKYSESPTASRGLRAEASSLNYWNEHLFSRDEEFLIPYNDPKFKGEQILKTIIKHVRIPYVPGWATSAKFEAPDLASCTKVEIQYQPSMLELYFPYASQQILLSPEEIEYLRFKKVLVVEDTQGIKAIANDIAKTAAIRNMDRSILGRVIRYRSKVDVVCFPQNKPSFSFSIYKDNTIVSEGIRGICYEGFPSLKMLTPQIQAIDLRMRCAANLKNLWYRFRFFHKTEATRLKDASVKRETTYPTPTTWCDAMLQPFYPTVEGLPMPVISSWDKKPHICPSAGEGKNHYAMNPNCEPNSPPDMVLLFETKKGWNQHGGLALLTFDNHNPKGGCVLLNDGTIKFIRTEEELHQLRWK